MSSKKSIQEATSEQDRYRKTGESDVSADLKRSALIIISATSFLFPFMASGVNIAIPSIGREFEMSAVSQNWVAASFLLAAAMFSVPFGRMADIYGRKKLFIFGLSVYALGSLLSGLATSQELLIICRVIQGIGGSMYSGSSLAIITSIFPAGERGRALGIVTASIYLGLSCGPFIGGMFTHYFSWRVIFLFNVPICLFILGLLISKLKDEWSEARGERFDYIGSILFSVTIIGTIYGFSTLSSKFGIVPLVIGALGLIFFILWEKKVVSPILDVKLLFKNRVYAFSNLAALINYSATFALTILLSMYLQYAKGLSAQIAGIILVTQPIIQAFLSPFAGRLSDKIEPRIVASVGVCLTTMGLFILSFLNISTGYILIIVCLFMLGVGFALFASPNTNAVMSSVNKKYLGVASSFLGTMRITGQTISMGISTLVFSIFLGKAKIEPKYFHLFIKSIRISFLIFCVLSFAAIFASLARGKSWTNNNNNSD